MENQENKFSGVMLAADKIMLVLDHVLGRYFDSDKPNVDLIVYEFDKIRNFIDIAYDYINIIYAIADFETSGMEDEDK